MTRSNRITARLLTLLAAMSIIASGCSGDSGGPTATIQPPPPPPAIEPILILGDGRTETMVATILADNGISVRAGGPYWSYDGNGLADVSAVILLTGYDYARQMPTPVQSRIAAFVADGGGLMTIEWLLFNRGIGAGLQDLIADIVPARYNNGFRTGSETYTVMDASHPVAQGFAGSFATPGTPWNYSLTTVDPTPSKSARLIFRGSASGAAVVAGVYGQGRTVHWNMAGEYGGSEIWSDSVRRLLVNIAKFVSKRT